VSDDLERLQQLAEIARGLDGRLQAENTNVTDTLLEIEMIRGAIRDLCRQLEVRAAALLTRADDLVEGDAAADDQEGFTICRAAAEQVSQEADAVSHALAAGPILDMAGGRLVDAIACELDDEDREVAGLHFVLIEHPTGQPVQPADEPVAAYTNEAAAKHMARRHAHDLPAGLHVSVYEADGLELLPDLIYRAAGTGGADGATIADV
jgi:hypothetical protein